MLKKIVLKAVVLSTAVLGLINCNQEQARTDYACNSSDIVLEDKYLLQFEDSLGDGHRNYVLELKDNAWIFDIFILDKNSQSPLLTDINDLIPRQELIESIYLNFRLYVLEKGLFNDTYLVERVNGEEVGLDGSGYIISALFEGDPKSKTLWAIWINLNIGSVEYHQIHSSINDTKSNVEWIKNILIDFVSKC